MSTTALSVGLACIIAAIVGGGMKALGIEVPTINSVKRQTTLAGFGVALLGIAFILSRPPIPPATASAHDTAPPNPSDFNSPALIGTWELAEGDSRASAVTLLELHADGTYKKTLSANVNNLSHPSNSYGGTHTGTWKSRGQMVYLSGDDKWPAYMQDLAKARKLN